MPHQAVIFLTGVNAKNTIRVSMTLPNGKKAKYELPCVSAAQSIEQLIEKQLYILVPFQMVQENKRLLQLKDSDEECNLPEEKRKALENDRVSAAEMVVDYQRKVRMALEKLQKDAKITSEEVDALTEVFKNIEHEMLKESKKILTEVVALGPQVTETYSQMLRREGREELIRNLLDSGMSPEEVAKRAKIPLEQVLEIQESVTA